MIHLMIFIFCIKNQVFRLKIGNNDIPLWRQIIIIQNNQKRLLSDVIPSKLFKK